MSTDIDLEKIKSRYTIRDILLDKLVLAVILIIIAFWVEKRLTSNEN